MNLNYLVGLWQSITISIIITFILALIYGIKRPWITNAGKLPINDEIKFGFLGLIIAIFFSFALFNSVFSIINFAINLINIDDIFSIVLEELKSGVFALRITSISLFAIYLKAIHKIIWLTPFPNEITRTKYFNYEYVKGCKTNCNSKINFYEFCFLGITQKSFYLLVLSVLWLQTIMNYSNLYSSLLSYSLLYIIDDWSIVFNHTLLLKGKIKKFYNYKIWILNIVLIILGVISLGGKYTVMTIFTSFSLIILYYRVSLEFRDIFGHKKEKILT